MSVHSFSEASLHSMRARFRTVALNLLTAFWGGSVSQYQPEAHYMRGPGPKWREKHGRNRETAGFIQRPLILSDKWDLWIILVRAIPADSRQDRQDDPEYDSRSSCNLYPA